MTRDIICVFGSEPYVISSLFISGIMSLYISIEYEKWWTFLEMINDILSTFTR